MTTSGQPGCLGTIWLGLVSLFGLSVLGVLVYVAALWSSVAAGVIAFGAVVGVVLAARTRAAGTYPPEDG